MSVGDTFQEQAKRQLLNEYQEASDVGSMLDQSPTNSRNNQEMGRACYAMMNHQRGWKANWNHFFDGAIEDLQRLYLNLDGYSSVQAIEMQQAHTVTEKNLEQKAEKKKGGIFGLFG